MYLFELRFTSRTSLLEAFRRVQERSAVESCALESEKLQLRLVAPQETAVDIAERIYLDGGLSWCTGHALRGCDGR